MGCDRSRYGCCTFVLNVARFLFHLRPTSSSAAVAVPLARSTGWLAHGGTPLSGLSAADGADDLQLVRRFRYSKVIRWPVQTEISEMVERC
jgi:hypothetical protein